MTSRSPAPYLLIKHSTGWNVDRCTRWMESNNVPFEYCYPVEGDAFPDPSRYAGVIIFGGRWSANDCQIEPWVTGELDFIERVLATETRFFGVCLGAQMLARVLGARVTPHPDGLREVGSCRIDPVATGRDFLAEPLSVMQWHTEGFDLPSGTRLLATSDAFPNQAYAMSERVVGVQFHPEVNPDVLAIWQERNRQRKPDDLTEEQRVTMRRDALRDDATVTAWLDGFLSGWTGLRAKAA